MRDTLEVVEKFLKETAGLELSVNNIDYIARLGRRRGHWPILVNCRSFVMHLRVLRNKKKISGLERLELMKMSGNKQNGDWIDSLFKECQRGKEAGGKRRSS